MATREQIAEVYVATFNRAADANGLSYWDGTGIKIDDRTVVKTDLTDIEDIASAMLDSPEVQEMYGDPDSPDFNREAFIIQLYKNILNKEVDSTDEGVQYWLSSDIDNAKMILAILNGAKAETGDPKDRATINNKTEVGIAFADAGLNNIDNAKIIMSNVTFEDESVVSAKDLILAISNNPEAHIVKLGLDEITTADDKYSEIFDISNSTTYTQKIVNFDIENDKLNFGKDIDATFISIDNVYDDGEVELSYVVNGGERVISIILTGLTSEEDMFLTTSEGLNSILI